MEGDWLRKIKERKKKSGKNDTEVIQEEGKKRTITYMIQVAGWVKAHTEAPRASDLSKPKQLHRLVFRHQHRRKSERFEPEHSIP